VAKNDMTASFDRPVKGQLWVRLDNGDEWKAGPDDLGKFGLGNKLDLYVRARDMLAEGLGLPPGEIPGDDRYDAANLVRYLIECALMYAHSPWANEKGEPWAEDAEYGDDVREALQAALISADQVADDGQP